MRERDSSHGTGITKQHGPRSFRCFVYPKYGFYVAECVDLYLVVKGKTEDRAIQSLIHAVRGHVQVALEMQEPQLLWRPSPLLHRLRFFWSALLGSAFATAKDTLGVLKMPHSFRIEA